VREECKCPRVKAADSQGDRGEKEWGKGKKEVTAPKTQRDTSLIRGKGEKS